MILPRWRVRRISDWAHVPILEVRWELLQERSRGIRPQWKTEIPVMGPSVPDAEFSEPSVLTPRTPTSWPRTPGHSVLCSRLLLVTRTPLLNRGPPGAGQRLFAGSHSRGYPLVCVLGTPASCWCSWLTMDHARRAVGGWSQAPRLWSSLVLALRLARPADLCSLRSDARGGGTLGCHLISQSYL